jgi:hypothetical protein
LQAAGSIAPYLQLLRQQMPGTHHCASARPRSAP